MKLAYKRAHEQDWKIVQLLEREAARTSGGLYKAFETEEEVKKYQAIIIYLKLGFKIDGWKDNFFGDGQPRIKMVRSVKNG